MTHSPAQDAFAAGSYAAVVTLLQGQARSAREYALLGIALLRTGQLAQAESSLHRATILGDPEGTVEHGNLLRLLGRYDEARAHLEEVLSGLPEGELKLRALRWWGVAAFEAGDTQEGLRKVERAWHGYVALGDDALTASVTQSLAQMHAILGHVARAKLLLQEAIHALPIEPDPAPRLSALKNLLDLQIRGGEFADAHTTLVAAKQALSKAPAPRVAAHLLCSEAELYRLSGGYKSYARTLEALHPLAEELGDHHLRVWAISRLAEHQSLMNLHGQALGTLHGFGLPEEQWPAELWATDGVLRRRRGDYETAYDRLATAASAFRQADATPELIRVLLHLAACELRLRREVEAARSLSEALTAMLRLKQLHEFKPDVEELSELMHYALLEPDLAPYLEPLLDRLAHLAGTPRLAEDGAMRLHVTTLGRVAVTRDGEEVRFAYPNSPLLLTYLTLHPGRTRAQMQLELFPDKDDQTGSSYLRQCIWDLRDKLGPEVVGCSGPHRAPVYRLGPGVQVELDFSHLLVAVKDGEAARALALYRGEFLPGVEESDWVRQRREETLLALTIELRKQMTQARERGDWRRVVLFANQVLKVDPLDVEVLQERVRAAQRVDAPAHELARYVSELHRVYH
ncbi:hypothetical protein DAETH_42770 (plasmid) [Deinococcus aetherius]|uniref:Bacterial transcriptional activator domain-containing protein n=1 Tax=Deinococcus aetherius TaxID=200252 RepID=A0ABM8AKF2_9DEIO|nr:BTAD domain-containing putative transcriptional regulator [Deinococcus aetherius]BDP44308.1 hypothetical protein DAETH_42770 [Deinococcus aetherius]